MISREHLEVVVQKKKITEVHQWFHEHFISSSQENYTNRCPFIIIQGPTGCGKTSTIKCVARELKISIQDYSETTDTTAIVYDLAGSHVDFHDNSEERSNSIDKRKANKFERFVIEHLRFTTLYPTNDEPLPPSADSEFESDDDFPSTLTRTQPPPKAKPSGIIIHIESPLSFARTQKILIQTILRLMKIIKDLSRTVMRRIAIVFESLECERESLSLPTKLKNSLGIQTIKFNPIIRTNLRRFIEMRLKCYSNLMVDKETIELLINDCDGDLRACNNTLEMLHNRVNNYNNLASANNDFSTLRLMDTNQVNKRQRLNPQRLKLNENLLRGVAKSLGFFHTLGKIFYQKRLYPQNITGRSPRSIDRPYRPENSTEYLVSRLEIAPKNLLAWLHQHYVKFCDLSGIDKAALFLDHLSDVDTISLDATQSAQFYEMHSAIDQLQSHIAIESTVFSLYKDQSKSARPSHKRIPHNGQTFTIKSSVECSANGNGDLYSFSKPVSLSVPKLVDDHRVILSHCASMMMQYMFKCADTEKILIDYLPYLKLMLCNMPRTGEIDVAENHSNAILSVINDQELTKLIDVLAEIDSRNSNIDLDQQHERLVDLIDDLETKSKAKRMEFPVGSC